MMKPVANLIVILSATPMHVPVTSLIHQVMLWIHVSTSGHTVAGVIVAQHVVQVYKHARLFVLHPITLPYLISIVTIQKRVAYHHTVH